MTIAAHTATASTTKLIYKVKSHRSAMLDLNPDGGAGDQIVFDENLYKQGTRVGEDRGVCTATFQPAKYSCHITFTIWGRGQIVVDGMTDFKQSQPVLAIVGGTREFRRAQGWFDFTTQNPTTFTDTFHLSS
jgi:hypothetical protein